MQKLLVDGWTLGGNFYNVKEVFCMPLLQRCHQWIGGIVNPLTQCLRVTSTLVCCSVFFQCAVQLWLLLWRQLEWGPYGSGVCASFLRSWAAFDNNLSFAERSQETVGRVTLSMLCLSAVLVCPAQGVLTPQSLYLTRNPDKGLEHLSKHASNILIDRKSVV